MLPCPENPVIAVLGATGTGKSQLAIDLCLALGGAADAGRPCEVVNADAMQLYAGLPVITNKVTATERRGVVHHLLGGVELDGPAWTVSRYVEEARRIIDGIHGRGGVAVVVGGTHYYLQSLLFGGRLVVGDKTSTSATTDDDTGAGGGRDGSKTGHGSDSKTDQIQDELDRLSTPEMYARLQQVDPVMAQRWHPNDGRKIRRSLEIWMQTGRRASEVYAEQQAAASTADGQNGDDDTTGTQRRGSSQLIYPTIFFWTHTSRDVLNQRLNRRVDKMLASGLLDEVKQLTQVLSRLEEAAGKPVDQTQGIWVSIGFKEFRNYVQALDQESVGESERQQLLQTALEESKTATRQYAKSQLKWIRIKLLLALKEAGAMNALWPLSTDRASEERYWESDVSRPAVELARRFLETGEVPSQHDTLPPDLLELLQPRRDYDMSRRSDLWHSQTCPVCHVTATTELEWEKHVSGNRHKKLVSKQKKRQERALAGLEIGKPDPDTAQHGEAPT